MALLSEPSDPQDPCMPPLAPLPMFAPPQEKPIVDRSRAYVDLTASPGRVRGKCLGIVSAEAQRMKSSNNTIFHPQDTVTLIPSASTIRIDTLAGATIGYFPHAVAAGWILPLMQCGKVEIDACIGPEHQASDMLNLRISVYHNTSAGPIDFRTSVDKDAWARFAQLAGVSAEYIMNASRSHAAPSALSPPIPTTSAAGMGSASGVNVLQNLLSTLHSTITPAPASTASTAISLDDDEDTNPHTVIDLTSSSDSSAFANSQINIMGPNSDAHLKQLFENLHTTTLLAEMEPSETLKAGLRPYQKQALAWLVGRERDEAAEAAEAAAKLAAELPPNWKEYHSTINGTKYYYNTVTEETTYERPTIPLPPTYTSPTDIPSSSVRGGLLCDEMGLGKTVEVIALITTNRPRPQDPKPTLIVTPLSVLNQWADEIRMHTTEGALSVYLYHGPLRCRDPAFLVRYDVVLTTFTTLAAELQEEEETPSTDVFENKEVHSVHCSGVLLVVGCWLLVVVLLPLLLGTFGKLGRVIRSEILIAK